MYLAGALKKPFKKGSVYFFNPVRKIKNPAAGLGLKIRPVRDLNS